MALSPDCDKSPTSVVWSHCTYFQLLQNSEGPCHVSSSSRTVCCNETVGRILNVSRLKQVWCFCVPSDILLTCVLQKVIYHGCYEPHRIAAGSCGPPWGANPGFPGTTSGSPYPCPVGSPGYASGLGRPWGGVGTASTDRAAALASGSILAPYRPTCWSGRAGWRLHSPAGRALPTVRI